MADSKESAADGETSDSAQVPGRLRKFAHRAIFPGLFATALAISWLCRSTIHEPELDGPEKLVEQVKTSIKKIEGAGNPVESLARGDDALQRHLYAQAVSYYEDMLAGAAAGTPLVDYRVGLCQESLGQKDRAIAAFRRALTAATTPTLACACQLGMARCLLYQNQAAEARRLLYPLLFDETRQKNIPPVLAADAQYLNALALARESSMPALARLSEDSPLSFADAPMEISFYLEELGPASKKPKDGPVPAKGPSLVVQKTEKSGLVVVSVDRMAQPAWELFDQLAQQASQRIDWSEDAKNTLSDRTMRLAVRNWPLLELLEQLADCFDLACEQEGEVFHIKARREIEPGRLTLLQRAMAGRALRRAIAGDANHTWVPAAYLELGNGERAQGREAEAAKWFERIIKEAQNSPYVGPAYYNLANLHASKLDFSRARQGYFRVVDQSAGNELALRALLRIGQLYLEEENIKDAIVHLRRTQILAPQSRYRPLATLVLAAAYMREDNPEQARIVLAKQRASLQRDPFRPAAAFLDAYAQYQLAKSTSASRREASDLLSTLWRDQEETLLGPLGHGLMAQAYRDLGFWDQAEKLLRQAGAHTRGPTATWINYLLAETILKQGRRAEALGLFKTLAATPSTFRNQARFQIAQIDLHEGRFKECAQTCGQLWAEQSFADQAMLLRLWGSALESSGDLAKAAQCFAGKAPQ